MVLFASGAFAAGQARRSLKRAHRDMRRSSLAFTLLGHAASPPSAEKRHTTSRRPQHGVLSCAFSPRGDFLCSGGADGQLLVWRTNAESLVGGAADAEPLPSQSVAMPPPVLPPVSPAPSWMPHRGWSPSPVPAALLARPHAPEPPEQTPEPEGCGPEEAEGEEDITLQGVQAEASEAPPTEATLQAVLAQLHLISSTLTGLEGRMRRQEAQLARVMAAM